MTDILREERLLLTCPECSKGRYDITHCVVDLANPNITKSAGPWYCDECGRGHRFEFSGTMADPRVDVTRHNVRKVTTTCVLELNTTDFNGPVEIDVDGMLFLTDGEETTHSEAFDAQSYYYNEHTCPTNYLRHVEEIRVGEDHDPHGIFTLKSIVIHQEEQPA